MPALPRIEPVGSARPGSPVVLVLHGGQSQSTQSSERRRSAYWRMVPFAHLLARHGLDVRLLRYRVRGWHAPARAAQAGR